MKVLRVGLSYLCVWEGIHLAEYRGYQALTVWLVIIPVTKLGIRLACQKFLRSGGLTHRPREVGRLKNIGEARE